jgi:hypothetical protein
MQGIIDQNAHISKPISAMDPPKLLSQKKTKPCLGEAIFSDGMKYGLHMSASYFQTWGSLSSCFHAMCLYPSPGGLCSGYFLSDCSPQLLHLINT